MSDKNIFVIQRVINSYKLYKGRDNERWDGKGLEIEDNSERLMDGSGNNRLGIIQVNGKREIKGIIEIGIMWGGEQERDLFSH